MSAFAASYSASDSTYAANALYTGCLIGTGSTKNRGQDSWGNIKVPMIESLDSDHRGWVGVPLNATYSSLLGIPVSGITDKNTTFSIQSYYRNVQCYSIGTVPATGDWLSPLNIPSAVGHNETSIWGQPKQNSFYLGTYTNETNARIVGSDSSPVELVLLSQSVANRTSLKPILVTVANCSMTPTFVETSIQCLGKSCRVDRIRDSTAPRSKTPVPLMLGFSQLFTLWSSGLAGNGVSSIYSTPTEHYLSGQTDFPFSYRLEFVNLYNVSKTDLSLRLSQIVNTYWLASLAPEASTRNLPSNPQELVNGNSTILGNFFPFEANATSGTTSYLEEIYVVNKGYLGALIVSSTLLLLAGVAGTIMKYMAVGPDVLGYVSTILVHDVHAPEAGLRGNSTMNALERAKSMHGLKIRLEDVRPLDEQGHIAIASISGRGDTSRSLKPGRLYS